MYSKSLPSLNFKGLYRLKFYLFLSTVLFSIQSFSQGLLAPAKGFNVFVQNNVAIGPADIEGGFAGGGTFTFSPSSSGVSNYAGNANAGGVGLPYGTVGTSKYAAVIGGSINWTGSTDHFDFNIPASAPLIKFGNLNGGSYSGTTFRIANGAKFLQINGNRAQTTGFQQTGIINFATEFSSLKSTSTCLSSKTATLATPSGNSWSINLSALANNTIHILNVTGSQLNALSSFEVSGASSTKILVVNVNASGSFTMNTVNQNSNAQAPFILWNFYNATTLSIPRLVGSLLAPLANVTKPAGANNIDGQVVASSYTQLSGETHIATFNSALTCATCSATGGTIAASQNLCTPANPGLFSSSVAGSVTSGTLSYSWESSTDSSNWNIITGASAVTYDAPSGLTITTWYRRKTSSTVGCSANSNVIKVTVSAFPIIAVSALPSSICAGTPSILSFTPVSGMTVLGWYPSSNGTGTSLGTGLTQSVSPTVATTYSVIARNAAGCRDTASTTVSINIKPNAGTDKAVCAAVLPGGTVTMDATGTGTWSGIAGNPGTSTITTSTSPVSTITNFSAVGIYKYKWTKEGCSDTAIVVVTGNCCPVYATSISHSTGNVSNVTNSLSAPDNSGTTFTGNGVYTRIVWNMGMVMSAGTQVCFKIKKTGTEASAAFKIWYGLDGSLDANGNPSTGYTQVYSTTNFTSTSYTDVCVTLPEGNCRYVKITSENTTDFNVDAVTASVSCPSPCTNPVVSVSATSATICKNNSTTLSFSPTSGLTVIGWFASANGTGSSLGTSSTRTVSPATTTTYSVVVQNAGGCRDTAFLAITVNNPPTPNATSAPTTACKNTSIQFCSETITGIQYYEWIFQGATPSTSKNRCENVTWSTTGTKTVKLYYIMANGCVSDTISYTVNVGDCCTGKVTGLYFSNGTSTLPIQNNAIFNVSTVSGLYYFEANTTGTIGSIKYTIDGPTSGTTIENSSPYNHPGTGSGNWTGVVGTYSVNLKTYSDASAGGTVCHDTTITFTLINPNCDCPGNLVLNPSFENFTVVSAINVPTNWTSTEPDNVFQSDGFAAQCGNYSGQQDGTSNINLATFYQDIPLAGGSGIQLKFKGGTHTPADIARFGLIFFNGSIRLGDSSFVDVDHILGSGTMQDYLINALAPLNATKVRVIGKTGADWLKVDQVCLSVTALPASIGDKVWNDVNTDGQQALSGEPGIAGVIVKLLVAGLEVKRDTTDANGIYGFNNLPPGSYGIDFDTPGGYTQTIQNAGNGATDSDAGSNGITGIYTLTAGQNETSVDAGYYLPSVNLGNYVWYDQNNNGIQDGGEAGIAGASVQLYSGAGVAIGTPVITTSTGLYNFNNLTPGDYIVGVTPPAGFTSSTNNGGDPDIDTDNNDDNGSVINGAEIRSLAVTLTSGGEPISDGDGNNGNLTVDFGFTGNGSIGDYAWIDGNKNGKQDIRMDGLTTIGPELPVAGIIIQLRKADNTLVAVDTTDATGYYRFVNLIPNTYYIQIVPSSIPTGYILSAKNASGTTTDNDSDLDTITFKSVPTILVSGEHDLSWDIGINKSGAAIADPCVWINNATNGRDGQFDEHVEVIATPGMVWRIISQTGMYLTSSPAPPAAPTPVPLNTALTETSSGVYTYNFIHVDSIGYSIVVTNGSETLSIANFCYYGDLIVQAFDTALCLTDAPITVNANGTQPGTIGYQVTTAGNILLNTNILDPQVLGLGIHNLRISFEPTATPTCINFYNYKINVSIDNCPASMGNFVWNDINADGDQDAGEPGIGGASVTLTNVTTNTTINTSTGSNGKYLFTGLAPGTYKVTFGTPAGGYVPTTANVGTTSDALDSDAGAGGMTGNYTLVAGQVDTSVDAGFYVCPGPLTFPSQSICGTQKFNLNTLVPTLYTGGTWTITAPISGSVSNPASVGVGTYLYSKVLSNECIITGSVTISKIGPDYIPEITLQKDTTFGIQPLNLVYKIFDNFNVQACSDVFILSPRLGNRYSFVYDPFLTLIEGPNGTLMPVTNEHWQYITTNPNFHVWKWIGDPGNGVPSLFPAGHVSYLGITGQYNPLNTDGFTTFTIQVSQGSGGELITNNDTDSQTLIYFKN